MTDILEDAQSGFEARLAARSLASLVDSIRCLEEQ
jgi:hypothetical protein